MNLFESNNIRDYDRIQFLYPFALFKNVNWWSKDDSSVKLSFNDAIFSFIYHDITSIKESRNDDTEHHMVSANGTESWYETDKNKNIIHSLDNEGNENWYEYNASGKLTYSKSINSNKDISEEFIDYNDANQIIYHKDKNGLEEWKEYDNKGNLIHTKRSNGYEEWKEYDDNNRVIHEWDTEGKDERKHYIFNVTLPDSVNCITDAINTIQVNGVNAKAYSTNYNINKDFYKEN